LQQIKCTLLEKPRLDAPVKSAAGDFSVKSKTLKAPQLVKSSQFIYADNAKTGNR
jgi:hypothetical protein